MKKLLFIFCLFLWLNGTAQFPINPTNGFPINSTNGTATTTVLTRGISAADSAFWLRTNFADTLTANKGLIKNIPGAFIRVNDTLYLRSQDLSRWIKQGGSGGSGSITGADQGLTNSGSLNQWGQLVGTTGNPAFMSTNREAPVAGLETYFGVRDTTSAYETRVSAAQIIFSGPLGGGASMYIQPGDGHAFPGVSYLRGLPGSGVTLVGTGVDYVGGIGGHYYIDMRDSIRYFGIEGHDGNYANFGTDIINGITQLGLRGRVVFGSTLGSEDILGDVDNIGSTYLRDSLMLAKKMYITDSTGYDILMSARASPYETKIITIGDLATLLGVGSIPGIDDVLLQNQAFTIGHETDLGGFTWDVGGVNTGFKLDNANSVLALSSSDDIRMTAPDIKLVTAPSFINDTSYHILVRNPSDGEIFQTYSSSLFPTLQQVFDRESGTAVMNKTNTIDATGQFFSIIGSNLTFENTGSFGSVGLYSLTGSNGSVILESNQSSAFKNNVIGLNDSITIRPWLGQLDIDSLRDALNNSKIMTWNTNGAVGSATIGSGLSLSAGVLSATSSSLSPIGFVTNTSFPGTSIPSNWEANAGGITITYSNALNVSGPGTLTNNYVRSTFVSTSNNYYLNANVLINTKPTNHAEGLTITRFGSPGQSQLYVTLAYADASDSMRLQLRVGPNLLDSTSKIVMANGNTYNVFITQSNNTIYYRIQLLSGGNPIVTKEKLFSIPIGYSSVIMPSQGKAGVICLGGSYSITPFQQYDYDLVHADVLILGTSITQGYYANSFEEHYLSKSFEGTTKHWVNYGSESATVTQGALALPEIYLAAPTAVGIEAGVNDVCANLRLWVPVIDSLQAHGIEVFWIKDYLSSVCKDSVIQNICTEQGIALINGYAGLSAADVPDGTHPNSHGFTLMAKNCKSQGARYFGSTGSIDGLSLPGLRDVLLGTTPSNGDQLTYNSTTKQWNNTAASLTAYINNQTASPQIGGFYVTTSGSVGTKFGIGAAIDATYRLYIEDNTSNGAFFKMTNLNNSANLTLSPMGSGGFGITGWANAGILEGTGTGGVVISAQGGGPIVFQVGSSRTIRGVISTGGLFGFGTQTPTQMVTVNGQVRINAITSGAVSDSVVTILGGSLRAIPAFTFGYVEKTGTYGIATSDYTINCTANTFTVTLPTAVGIAGHIFNIVNSGAGIITIATTSSQVFSNVAATPTTLTLSSVGSYTLQSTGAAWIVL